MSLRVLFLAHNHPALQPGGTEAFARGLFRGLRGRPGVTGMFLGAVTSAHRERRPGTLLQGVGDANDELLVSLDGFDRFFLSQPDAAGLAATLGPLVSQLRPDIIHMHHPLQFGIETIDLLRRLAPRAAMVLTLHDYFLICPREGQLLTAEGRLCRGPSADACRRCLPGRSAIDLALRDNSVRDACRAFDQLLSPSHFLRERFIAAGWNGARIAVLPNGVPAVPAVPAAPRARRDRFAFLGNINRFKGPLVAIEASRRLSSEGIAHRLALHGGTPWQSKAFLADFTAALAAAPAARHHGPYEPADLPSLMAATDWVLVPSVWWENAPLVILEAQRYGRPVICGDAGGMAELVQDDVNGLHAPINDPAGWAATLYRAIETPGLWERLADAAVPPATLDVVAAAHLDLYHHLLAARQRSAAA